MNKEIKYIYRDDSGLLRTRYKKLNENKMAVMGWTFICDTTEEDKMAEVIDELSDVVSEVWTKVINAHEVNNLELP